MKIIIIGSGISGLSVYHFLQKHINGPGSPHTIKIYEAFPKTVRAVGGGLGLAPNGMRALNALSPAIVNDVILAPENSFRNSVYTLRNAYGTTLTRMVMGTEQRYGFPNIMLPRASVYDGLERDLPPGAVTHQCRAVSICEKDEGVEVCFEDGSVELADLVLGADGVRSVVRPLVVGEGYEAEYRGLTAIGSFLPVDTLPPYIQASLRADPLVMTFGPDGFFGYAVCTSLDRPDSRLMWWSTFSSTTPPPRDLPLAHIKAHLLARHQDWVSPDGAHVHRDLIALATSGAHELMVLPTYITPPLPRFATPSGRVVLLGDAAHAMPPDSGQGASLALEDSQAVALLLKHYLCAGDEGAALQKTARAFEMLRGERTARILEEAKQRGERKKAMSWWQERVRDWLVWGVGLMSEARHDWKYAYDVAVEVEKFLETHDL